VHALFAAAGLPEQRRDGDVEPPVFTGGADLDAVRHLSPERDGYSATAAIAYIHGT
jgi:hypothetical protein